MKLNEELKRVCDPNIRDPIASDKSLICFWGFPYDPNKTKGKFDKKYFYSENDPLEQTYAPDI